MGDQTTSVRWKQQLNQVADPLSIIMVDERYSSLEARDRYWQILYPPRGYFAPPRAVWGQYRDQWMTLYILLIRRYLERLVSKQERRER